MIDTFSLALTHFLIILAAWRILSRRDLDDDSEVGGADENAGGVTERKLHQGWSRR